MTPRRSLGRSALLACWLAGCATGSVPEHMAEDRLAKAEVEMKLCKEGIGLGAAPTPTTTGLYDPATSAIAQDAVQVKIKTLCGRELRELLEAQRMVKQLQR